MVGSLSIGDPQSATDGQEPINCSNGDDDVMQYLRKEKIVNYVREECAVKLRTLLAPFSRLSLIIVESEI